MWHILNFSPTYLTHSAITPPKFLWLRVEWLSIPLLIEIICYLNKKLMSFTILDSSQIWGSGLELQNNHLIKSDEFGTISLYIHKLNMESDCSGQQTVSLTKNKKKVLNEICWTKYLLHHYKEENREIL